MEITSAVRNYYTDILCHEFSKSSKTTKLAVGTSFGDLYFVGEENDSRGPEFSPISLYRTRLAKEGDDEPVLNLCWDEEGYDLLVLSNKNLYRVPGEDIEGSEDNLYPEIMYASASEDLMDFAFLKENNKACVVSDDGKIRLLDLHTQTIIKEFVDHKGIVQVCKASDDFVATGGVDGFVHIYEAGFRTDKKICSFGDKRNLVNNLDISENSTWLAVSGAETSEFPVIYNIKSRVHVPIPHTQKTTETEKIFAVHFDSDDTLYWGGANGIVYKTDDLLVNYTQLKTTYGLANIRQIYSISTRLGQGTKFEISAAGSTNGVLFSSNGVFWDSMINLQY